MRLQFYVLLSNSDGGTVLKRVGKLRGSSGLSEDGVCAAVESNNKPRVCKNVP